MQSSVMAKLSKLFPEAISDASGLSCICTASQCHIQFTVGNIVNGSKSNTQSIGW